VLNRTHRRRVCVAADPEDQGSDLNVGFAFAWCYVLCDMTPMTLWDIVYIVLVGHVGFIGADVFYKAVEGKWSYFKPLSQINHKDED